MTNPARANYHSERNEIYKVILKQMKAKVFSKSDTPNKGARMYWFFKNCSQYLSKSELFNLFKNDFLDNASVNIEEFLSSLSVFAPSTLNKLDPCVFVFVDSICNLPEVTALVW